MTDFCHISPTALLDKLVRNRTHHLTLAHLVETDPDYAQWYVDDKQRNPYSTIIMDNSAFEMYKQRRPMYDSSKLIDMGSRCAADYIVMSDYPAEDYRKTIDAAVQMAPSLRHAGFGTFFVPQSEIGDLGSLIESFRWASHASEVDYIGVSILAVPNAYGVERDNKLQRHLSRWAFMQLLEQEGVLDTISQNNKKMHFLGMVDGPTEITLVRRWKNLINTWDSSAAVWAGLNGIHFDLSPTGMLNGKFEKEVDFNFNTDDELLISTALSNMNQIDALTSNVEAAW